MAKSRKLGAPETGMTGEDLKAMFEAVLPDDVILAGVERSGLQRRQRKMDAAAFVRALVFCGGSSGRGQQASVLRAYLDMDIADVDRSAFYQWFKAPLAELMESLGAQACRYASSMVPHLPGLLDGVRDWRAIDSTTVKLHDALKGEFPGTGDYAALKVHKEYSLGVENVVDYHITPAREHDGPQLVVDEERRGTGLVVDLGYASFNLLRQCREYDVKLVIRLKKGWHVHIDDSVNQDTMASWLGGHELASPFSVVDVVNGPGEPLDVDVSLGPDSDPILMRLVSVPTAKGHCVFLTNLPRDTHSYAEVGLLYRLRWCVEVDNKLSKSCCQLDEINSRTAPSAMALVHASMVASILANAIAHLEHARRGAVGNHRQKFTKPPLHPMRVANMMAQMAMTLSSLMGDPDAPQAKWDRAMRLLWREGKAPNWRKKPSPIDVVKGRTPALIDAKRFAEKPVHTMRGLN